MHRLQQHILYQLATNPSLRYSQLKPAEVEGNAFMYHLKSIIKTGYVGHVDDAYLLTPAGQLYVDRVRLKTFDQALQPKIVLLIVARNSDGEVLFFKRSRHPLINKVGLPYGKLHEDETISQASAREFKKKTGYDAKFNYHSTGIMKIREQGELISYILYLLVEATDIEGEILSQASAGTAFWAKPNPSIAPDLIPSVIDILKIADHPAGEYHELVYDL